MAPSATSPPFQPQATKDSPVIPLIDFKPLLEDDPPTKLQASHAILQAFENSGFLYLTNHPIPRRTLSTIFAHSAAFFARPQSQKDSIAWTTPSSNRGYSTYGREKTSQALSKSEVEAQRDSNPDLKESIEIGREDEKEHPNRWPDEFDPEGQKFKEVMQDFFLKCKEMHRLFMSAIALAMNLPKTYFDEFVVQGDNTLRLLHYPPVKKSTFEKNKGQVRAGAHTDYGSVTFLFQDGRGGLQVQGPSGGWLDVKPIEGACIVNAGDLLARWSNDLIKSTMHRVIEPPSKTEEEEKVVGQDEAEEEYPARYSIAYFCNPDFNKWIEALPGTWEKKRGGKRYEGVNSGDYLLQRLSVTY